MFTKRCYIQSVLKVNAFLYYYQNWWYLTYFTWWHNKDVLSKYGPCLTHIEIKLIYFLPKVKF